MTPELEKRYIFIFIIFGILVLALFGTLCAFSNTNANSQNREQMPAETVYIEKEVEKIVIETVYVYETIEVESPYSIFYTEVYFANIAKEQKHWENCSLAYPTATYVWQYLVNDLGYSDYVAAGIIGNMMNECGGNTLNLQYDLYGGDSNYYGLCMWSLKYHENLGGADIDTQLAYLADSIEDSFNNYGYLYMSDFTHEDFCALTDSQAAALAFMRVYERPSSASKVKRQTNALKAYQFFVVN